VRIFQSNSYFSIRFDSKRAQLFEIFEYLPSPIFYLFTGKITNYRLHFSITHYRFTVFSAACITSQPPIIPASNAAIGAQCPLAPGGRAPVQWTGTWRGTRISKQICAASAAAAGSDNEIASLAQTLITSQRFACRAGELDRDSTGSSGVWSLISSAALLPR